MGDLDDDTDPSAAQGHDRRVGARRLRTQGWLLREIASHYGVSVKTAYVDTKGIPVPARARHGGDAAHVAMMSARRWEDHRRQRDVAAQQRKLEAARDVGAVDDHTLLLLGAIAYWCEGAKSKPWRRRANFCFVNSDPLLLRLFVRWLALVDVPPKRWVVRLQIHETADVHAAELYWRGILDLPDLSFAPATIKRHKPLTNRKNAATLIMGASASTSARVRSCCSRLKAGSSEPCSERVENCQTRLPDRCENGPRKMLDKYSAVG